MKTGIVDVGGGERGVYGAGVFDRLLDLGVTFDYLIGVSAGAANGVTYLAGQQGRNLRFYTQYSFRSRYMGIGAFLHTGCFIDLEYIYGATLTNSGGEDPLDYEALMCTHTQMEIVATDAKTAEPVYYDFRDMPKDDYGPIKGSSCLPILAKAYRWRGRDLYDGGISDPIPFQRAFAKGCDRVVVILTRPRDDVRDPKRDRTFGRLLKLTHPRAGEALLRRAETYNRQLQEAKELERRGKVLIVAPDDIGSMKTLTKDREEIMRLYEKGWKDAEAIPTYLRGC